MAALFAKVWQPKDPTRPSSSTSGSMWHHVFWEQWPYECQAMPLHDDEINYYSNSCSKYNAHNQNPYGWSRNHCSNKAIQTKITLPTHPWSTITIQLSNFNKTLKIIDLKTKQPQPSIKENIFFAK
jgi:hypothetical protein